MARVRRGPRWQPLSIRHLAAASGLALLAGLTLIADRPESQRPEAAATPDAPESTEADASGHEGVPEGCGYEGAAGGGGYTGGRTRCGRDHRRSAGDDPAGESPELHGFATELAYAAPVS